ncbi:hypothetical protein BGY98DRAFT_1136541, partial [Russula aff. rugulosa BPL654]
IIPVQADNSRGRCRPRRHVGEAGNDHVKYCLPYCISHQFFLAFAMASNEEPETRATSYPSSNESNRDEPQARPDSQPNGQSYKKAVKNSTFSHPGRRTGMGPISAASVGKASSRSQLSNAQRAWITIPGSLQRMPRKFERFTSPSTPASPPLLYPMAQTLVKN